ncbi:MAG: LemA family protein [Paludibacteraceae bacterium]
MKKLSSTVIILIVLAILVFWGMGVYNGLVSEQEKVNAQWGNVENQYQRRSDLIPNLVETVKGYATHEKTTLEEVVNARAKATQVTVDPNNLTPEKIQEYQAAQGELTSALGRLMMIREAYPDLKANENFIALQNQLEQTENRIALERTRFNEIATTYNTKIKKAPGNIVANMFGFTEKPYFKAEAGSEKAPEVKF